MTDAAALRAAAERVAAELGTVDLLFNNAGVMLPAPVDELPVEQRQRQIDLNVTGPRRTSSRTSRSTRAPRRT